VSVRRGGEVGRSPERRDRLPDEQRARDVRDRDGNGSLREGQRKRSAEARTEAERPNAASSPDARNGRGGTSGSSKRSRRSLARRAVGEQAGRRVPKRMIVPAITVVFC
jgi:hypothetical protein